MRRSRQLAEPRLFLDIGAGKGKACFYASPRFERVIGVEYSALLVDAAKANLRRAGHSNSGNRKTVRNCHRKKHLVMEILHQG